MRRLKLMADYGCHPLWGTVDPEIGDLDPASLPLSAALVADLFILRPTAMFLISLSHRLRGARRTDAKPAAK